MKKGQKASGLWQQLDQSRQIVFRTGEVGAKQIAEVFYDVGIRTPLRGRASDALKKNRIDQNQYETLIKMIDSDDRENVVLAEAIIDEKHPVKKDKTKIYYGNPIYSPRPQVSKRKRGGVY